MFIRLLLAIALWSIAAYARACDVCGVSASSYTSLTPQWGRSQAGILWQLQRYEQNRGGVVRQTTFAQWFPTRHIIVGASNLTDGSLYNPATNASGLQLSRSGMVLQGGFRTDNHRDSVTCATRKGFVAMAGMYIPVWVSQLRDNYRTPDALLQGLFPTRYANLQMQYAWSKTKWGFFADAGCTIALRNQDARQGHTAMLNVSAFRRYERNRLKVIGFAALRYEYAGSGRWFPSDNQALRIAGTGGQSLATTLSAELYLGQVGIQLSASQPVLTSQNALRSPLLQTGFRFIF